MFLAYFFVPASVFELKFLEDIPYIFITLKKKLRKRRFFVPPNF